MLRSLGDKSQPAVAILAPKTGGVMFQSPCGLLGCPSLLGISLELFRELFIPIHRLDFDWGLHH